jgi:glycosyltransferase involved in cell wall biosynthesis
VRRVTVVILCWNRWDLSERCLATLKETTDLSTVDVLVVDNGSTDETPEKLKGYPWLKVVTNETNLGFVRGNNSGIAAADPGSDILLLNNDIEIHQPGWLDTLRRAAHASKDVGLVGCRLVFPDGKLIHAGTYILPDTFWGQQIGSLETDVNQYARTRDVQGIVFACAYIRREVIARIGGLSEAYTSYFEDTDYCLRAKDAGFRTVCCGAVTLVHVQHGSTSRMPGLFEKIFEKSRAEFRRRWTSTLEAHYEYPVHWQSILNFPTGYATTGRGILRELDALGVRMSYEYVYGSGSPYPVVEPENSGDYRLNVISGRKAGRRPEISIVYAVGEVFERNRGRYKIGYTMLEVDGFPEDWVKQANRMDEVWVPSSANRDAFVRCGVRKPVHVMPLGVDIDWFHPGIKGHPNAQGTYVFLANFEWGERKAPGLLLTAFNRTFRRNEPVILLCKIINKNAGVDVRREIEELELKESGGRIVFLHNRDVPYHELGSLYRSADCFVSAGHGEGWDMPLIEAMACGLPSIATDWGAHREFVHDGIAYPLRTRGTLKAEALCPYYKGFSWADPNPEHLERLLRHVYENREEAAAKGRHAAEEVAAKWTIRHTAERIKARLDQIVEDSNARRPVRAAVSGRKPLPCVAIDVSHTVGEQISGIGRYARNLCDGLARFGPDDLEFLLLPGFAGFVHPRYGDEYYVDSPGGRNVNVYRGPLPAFADARTVVPGVSLVHGTSHRMPIANGLPQLFTVHDLSYLTHPQLHTRENVDLCTANLDKARRANATFLAVSEHSKRDLVRRLGINPGQIRVVPNSYDDRRFRPGLEEDVEDIRITYHLPKAYFLFVGSLEPRKNLATLLAAVTEHDVGLPLVISGAKGWRNEDIRKRIQAASDRVETLGYVSDEDLPALYAGARALIYPSLYEGFGLPLLEAMACGTPVVSTRVSAIPEVVGEAGILLDDPTDASALAAALKRLAGDDAERARLSAAGLERTKLFSMEKVTGELVKVYREMLAAANSGP